MDDGVRIAFAWSGLPDYAARCIRQVVDRYPGRVTVIGTRPTVPITGMEHSLGQEIVWIDGDASKTWSSLSLPVPSILFRGGHFVPAFNALARDAKRCGAKIVGTSDANWEGSFRQHVIDPIRHRIYLSNGVDGYFVPGHSGLKHAKKMGYPTATTLPKVLGADPELFGGGGATSERRKQIIFVGRLEDCKNILSCCSAFINTNLGNKGWVLKICGTGPLDTLIPRHPSIRKLGFQQPSELSQILRDSRILLLPSLAEPWGLVVHEAALSGCALGLSSAVGAVEDLSATENSIVFQPTNQRAMEQAMLNFASWTDDQWDRAGDVSRELARNFGPSHFANSVDQFINMFGLGDEGALPTEMGAMT